MDILPMIVKLLLLPLCVFALLALVKLAEFNKSQIR